jgi:hypothetical protein
VGALMMALSPSRIATGGGGRWTVDGDFLKCEAWGWVANGSERRGLRWEGFDRNWGGGGDSVGASDPDVAGCTGNCRCLP